MPLKGHMQVLCEDSEAKQAGHWTGNVETCAQSLALPPAGSKPLLLLLREALHKAMYLLALSCSSQHISWAYFAW